jgi:hypothetical protein
MVGRDNTKGRHDARRIVEASARQRAAPLVGGKRFVRGYALAVSRIGSPVSRARIARPGRVRSIAAI